MRKPGGKKEGPLSSSPFIHRRGKRKRGKGDWKKWCRSPCRPIVKTRGIDEGGKEKRGKKKREDKAKVLSPSAPWHLWLIPRKESGEFPRLLVLRPVLGH